MFQAASSCFDCLDGILRSHSFRIEKRTHNSKVMWLDFPLHQTCAFYEPYVSNSEAAAHLPWANNRQNTQGCSYFALGALSISSVTWELKIRPCTPAKLKGYGRWCNVTVLINPLVLTCMDHFHWMLSIYIWSCWSPFKWQGARRGELSWPQKKGKAPSMGREVS